MDPLGTARDGAEVSGRGTAALCVDFDGGSACIAEARETAAVFLERYAAHAPATFRANLLLVVSELVTNVVRHAPGPLTLCLYLVAGGLDVSVADASTTLPSPRTPDLRADTGGFGWPIVERLARRVYSVTGGGGKTVHAELAW